VAREPAQSFFQDYVFGHVFVIDSGWMDGWMDGWMGR
jgi:hypothetical protein